MWQESEKGRAGGNDFILYFKMFAFVLLLPHPYRHFQLLFSHQMQEMPFFDTFYCIPIFSYACGTWKRNSFHLVKVLFS